VLTRDGRLDNMEVKVEARPEATVGAREDAAKELAHSIKATIGINARINVVDPDGIERSLGKARRIIDNRPRD
jgi:phenylacetate-CoA ligase